MILLEYEAKNILKDYNVPIPDGVVVKTDADPSDLSLPRVLKSQVPVGGRGKLGGVVVVKQDNELPVVTKQLFSRSIKEHIPTILLAEELLSISSEYYLAFRIDRDSACIILVAHTNGGVDIEDHAPESFFTFSIAQKSDLPKAARMLAEYYELPEKEFVIEALLQNIFECFTSEDATLLEINPLVVTENGDFVAADCKMELDNAADFRHPDWNFEAEKHNANFVTLNEQGTIATIANGAGLAMATVDAVAAHNLLPANFLDIGGGANEASVYAALQNIMKFPSIQGIVINIFAGITRCDEVAKAILQAKTKINNLPPLYIRLAGTNSTEAQKVLENHDIILYSSLEDCLVAVRGATV